MKRAWKYQEFPAHAGNVNSVSLGHKSARVLVTGGADKKVNLWAVGKSNCIMSLSGHSTPVDCVRFSITEEQVCAGSQAGALKIWDLESAKIVRTLTGHRASIRCVDFHPYGDFLASGSSDSAIKMWDIRKKGCIFGYKGHSSTVNSLKFSPDGQWIASGGEDNLVKIWDIRVGKVLSEFGNHTGPVSDVEFHPHEFLLASASVDRTVKFWDLETFTMVSSSSSDVPPVRCISFHPNGRCLFAASAENLRVHGWEPAETHDSVQTPWLKIQDIAISQDQLIGVSTQLTNVAIFIVDLSRVHPVGNAKLVRGSSYSSGHTLRKNFNKERSNEFAESLNAMKASEESDSLPTDPEDESLYPQPQINHADFRQVFHPHRDLNRTPPPPDELLPDEEPIRSTMSDVESKPEPVKRLNRNKIVNIRQVSNKKKSPEGSPRRSSVPSLQGSVPNVSISHHQIPSHTLLRSRSPEYLSSSTSRQSSLSDDSSGPMSSRSTEGSSLRDRPENTSYTRSMKPSPSEPSLSGRVVPGNPPPLTPSLRTERPLAQCQVKPMPKAPASLPHSPIEDPYLKTEEFCNSFTTKGNSFIKSEPQEDFDDYVPTPIDKPCGIILSDFLPKKSLVAFQGGYHALDVNEADVFNSLKKEHQTVVTVLVTRLRNLRIVLNQWQTKDVKTAVETATNMHDIAIEVDLLSVLTLRPSIWNLDLCVSLLPTILQLLKSRYESHMTAGCNSLRLILKNFSSVIKTNIESPIQTVGVDISREERYKKSMECYQHLVNIRNFTLKRQTVQGKIGHAFREIHILLSALD